MLKINEPSVMWAWVCPITGMVLDEAWGNTEPYARRKTNGWWGKRRAESGEMLAVRVTVEPLSAEETAVHRAEFAAREAKRKGTQP